MAKILDRIVDARGVREFAGIHAVVRIPERFEFAKRADEFRPEHFWQQRGARLSVAVLARERAAKGEHDVRSAINELTKDANALGAVEVEVDAHVHAALPVV